jgi:hypothetical protein
MSINPRTVMAWLLSIALTAVFAPIPVAEAHGGGGHGGGFGGGGSFHSSGNFSGHTAFHSESVGNWHTSTPHVASRAVVPNQFHTQSFAGRGEHWNAERFEHGDWRHGDAFWHHGRDFDDWWRFGFVGPWYSFGWWPGYYDYGYWGPYYGNNYGGYSYDVTPYTAYSPDDYVDTTPPTETMTPTESTTPIEANAEESNFYSQALAAFQQGDYRNATRLAGHAAIDDPKNPDVHLLISLGLFAAGQYRGAAMEAHAVAALGTVPDWPKLIGLYGNNVDSYTGQLRALEKFVRNNPSAPEGRFLLGFQYMMDGHHSVAQDQLLHALKLTPRDGLAAQLLTKAGGTIPAEIAKQLESARHQPPATGMGSGATK